MEALKQIANVAGYSGLYRILKPGRAGVIVESLDDKKAKTMMGPTARVSVLSDISIYVSDDDEQSVPLSDVLLAIKEKYEDKLPVDPKSDNSELADFMAEAVPNYDVERVRASDIKKLVSWYTILRQYAPEIFDVTTEEPKEEAAAEPDTTEVVEAPAAESPKKQKAQKA
ncbi:hypothetical protein GCM10028807_58420 [Spirosoma daeguense]